MRVIGIVAVALATITAVPASVETVSIVTAAPGRAAQHGIQNLEAALIARGFRVETVATIDRATGRRLIVAGTCENDGAIGRGLAALGAHAAETPEALAIRKTVVGGKSAIVLEGADDRETRCTPHSTPRRASAGRRLAIPSHSCTTWMRRRR